MLYTLLAQEHYCDLIRAMILDCGRFYVNFFCKLFTYCFLCWIKILK